MELGHIIDELWRYRSIRRAKIESTSVETLKSEFEKLSPEVQRFLIALLIEYSNDGATSTFNSGLEAVGIAIGVV
jgi:hypothetical protein